MDKKNTLFISIVLAFLFLGSLVWADSNGVWHRAEDIQGGVFGSDEQIVTSGYSFVNPVTFNDDVTIGTEIKVNTIRSNGNGNVVIILG